MRLSNESKRVLLGSAIYSLIVPFLPCASMFFDDHVIREICFLVVASLGALIVLLFLGRMFLRERSVFASHPWLLLPIAPLLLLPLLLAAVPLALLLCALTGVGLDD